jgi:hypothetical protein
MGGLIEVDGRNKLFVERFGSGGRVFNGFVAGDLRLSPVPPTSQDWARISRILLHL